MEFEPKASNRVSAIIFRRSEGKIWLLLHLARATRSKHQSRKQQLSLPEAPRSWITLTAKSYRAGGLKGNLGECAKKKCRWQNEQGEEQYMRLEECIPLILNPIELYGRKHFWVLSEMTDQSMPYTFNSPYFEKSEWRDEEAVTALARSAAMSQGWKGMLETALHEAQRHEADLGQVYRAFRDARQ